MQLAFLTHRDRWQKLKPANPDLFPALPLVCCSGLCRVRATGLVVLAPGSAPKSKRLPNISRRLTGLTVNRGQWLLALD